MEFEIGTGPFFAESPEIRGRILWEDFSFHTLPGRWSRSQSIPLCRKECPTGDIMVA
jgi:hypothetical protein